MKAFDAGETRATPNDLKLSERGAGHDACAAGLRGAGSVTRGTVRCSAWLGVAALLFVSLMEGCCSRAHQWLRATTLLLGRMSGRLLGLRLQAEHIVCNLRGPHPLPLRETLVLLLDPVQVIVRPGQVKTTGRGLFRSVARHLAKGLTAERAENAVRKLYIISKDQHQPLHANKLAA